MNFDVKKDLHRERKKERRRRENQSYIDRKVRKCIRTYIIATDTEKEKVKIGGVKIGERKTGQWTMSKK